MTKFPFILFVIVILFVQPVQSEEKTDSIKLKQINEITVYSNLYKNLAFPMVIVDKKSLEASSFFSPADALQRETGISIARDGIWASSVNIRGLSEQRLLIMVDGDRIQTASDIAAALSTIDLSNLEKIEVIKGASSVLYGTGAMGGVVNFVSERPKYSKSFISNGNIGAEFNTVNNLWGNNANIQFTNNQWYLSLNGSFRTAQDIKTPAGILPHSNFNDASWGLKAGIKYTPNQEFLVNYQHFGAWDVGLPGGRSFPSTATARYVGVERNQLSGEYIISDINFNLREIKIKAYTQNISRDVEVKPSSSIVLLPGSLNKTSGAKVTSDWRFLDYQTLTLGAEGWLRDAQTYRLKVVTSDSTVLVTGDQPTPSAEMLDLGIFAHYSWKLLPRKLTLNAGLRLDYIQTKNDSSFNRIFQYKITNNKAPVYVNNLSHSLLFAAGTKPELSYAAHVDVVYNLSINQQLALSVANSYRVPSIEERFKYIVLTGPKLVGNPNLRPEKGTFSNLNYTINNNRFRLKADIYVNYLVDLITEIYGPYTFLNESGISTTEQAFVNTNINTALFAGAELEAKWHIDNHLSVLANASYTRARDLDTQTFLPQIPPLHGFVAVNYLFESQFEASVSALWAARQAEVASTSGESPTDGSVIFNVDVHTGKIDLNKSFIQIYAGVNNILNTAYFNHLSTTRGIIRQEPGRNIYLKAKFAW
ncbi:MAG: TonB-dependent receptor [Paludibacter sp.]|nr:TonB-dependent receptor [Paludibacter sp.]